MSRAFVAPSRYIQGKGKLTALGTHIAPLGSNALFVADETVLDVVRETVEESFAAVSAELTIAEFGGECTAAEIDRLASIASNIGADVVIGAGGGKTIDTAKSVRAKVGGTMVSVPTVSSTDAPTSALSIRYVETGEFEGAEHHDDRPDLVLVDTGVVAAAPVRLFVSGIGDALATAYEADAVATSGGTTAAGTRPTRAGLALATECREILRSQAPEAVRAVERDLVTPAVEDVIEAIVLLSGLGFENGGLAGAHAVHDGLASVAPGDATHGEKVCLGLLTQLVLEGRSGETIRDIASFAATVGLPITLADVHIDASDDEMVHAVAQAACHEDSPIVNQPGQPGPADIRDALLSVDALGRSIAE
jgi:glycerol dehydrogenase